MPFPPVQPLFLLDLETSIVADFFFFRSWYSFVQITVIVEGFLSRGPIRFLFEILGPHEPTTPHYLSCRVPPSV